MTDDPFHYVRLANGMRVNEAARYLADLHSTKTALTPSEQELLAVAEGLLELVRQGTTVFMDSAAIEADLYDTALPEAPTATRPRPSDALRTCDRAALQVIFDRYGITDVQVFGSVARGADQPGSDLDLLFFGPDNFSAFTMIDLADDLEALLGVPVDLVSNHPANRGISKYSIRATAIPLSRVITPPTGEPAHSPAVRRAHDYRQRRLAQITSEWGSIDRLIDGCPGPTAVLSGLGWDDESIAFWLTAPNAYLPQQSSPAEAWVSGGADERDRVIYAACQNGHV